MIWYRSGQTLARVLWRPCLGRYEVHGLDNIPERGPFLLIANHQSYLDPVLVQAVIPRVVHTMTKSTQFSDPITGTLLKSFKTIPARRFEIDPQVVRLALRRLAAGDGVGIYIEGERTWDGTLQPPRLGTVRLVLKAGVPVVPCGVSGAYDVWPRWARVPRRGTVTVRFGEPLLFPRLDHRRDRDAVLTETADLLMDTIAKLAGVEQG